MRAAASDPRITLRVPADLMKELRDLYARTFPTHRMSWNSWVVTEFLWKSPIVNELLRTTKEE
jgi:hypothetical protein